MGLEFKNDIKSTSDANGVKCPLVDFMIEENNCLENAMIVSGFINENMMSASFKEKQNWREICKNCKNFSF